MIRWMGRKCRHSMPLDLVTITSWVAAISSVLSIYSYQISVNKDIRESMGKLRDSINALERAMDARIDQLALYTDNRMDKNERQGDKTELLVKGIIERFDTAIEAREETMNRRFTEQQMEIERFKHAVDTSVTALGVQVDRLNGAVDQIVKLVK